MISHYERRTNHNIGTCHKDHQTMGQRVVRSHLVTAMTLVLLLCHFDDSCVSASNWFAKTPILAVVQRKAIIPFGTTTTTTTKQNLIQDPSSTSISCLAHEVLSSTKVLPPHLMCRGGASKKSEESNEDDEDEDKKTSVDDEEEEEEDDEDDEEVEEEDDEEVDEKEEDDDDTTTQEDDAAGEYVEPYVLTPMIQLSSTFGCMMLSQRIGKSPLVVKLLRFMFIAYVALRQLFILYVCLMAKKQNNRTIITTQNPMSDLLQSQFASKGGDGASSMVKNLASSMLSTKRSVMDYDIQQAMKLQNGIIFNMLFMWVLHFRMGQIQPLLMQTVSGLLELGYSPLFQVYFLGRNLERPFKSPKFSPVETDGAEKTADEEETKGLVESVESTDMDDDDGNIKEKKEDDENDDDEDDEDEDEDELEDDDDDDEGDDEEDDDNDGDDDDDDEDDDDQY